MKYKFEDKKLDNTKMILPSHYFEQNCGVQSIEDSYHKALEEISDTDLGDWQVRILDELIGKTKSSRLYALNALDAYVKSMQSTKKFIDDILKPVSKNDLYGRSPFV